MGVNPGAGSVDGRAFDNNTLPARQGSRRIHAHVLTSLLDLTSHGKAARHDDHAL